MRVVAWDSWAFLEVALDRPRAGLVEDLLSDADVVVTSRDVVVETFNFIVKATGRTVDAWDWWEQLGAGGFRVKDVPLDQLHGFVARHGRRGSLGLTDYSLGLAAKESGARDVASEDHELKALGLVPLFSNR